MFGVKVIEKHFTYRKENQLFHDHAISADPKEMKNLVNKVRRAELIFGEYQRRERTFRKKKFEKYEEILLCSL